MDFIISPKLEMPSATGPRADADPCYVCRTSLSRLLCVVRLSDPGLSTERVGPNFNQASTKAVVLDSLPALSIVPASASTSVCTDDPL